MSVDRTGAIPTRADAKPVSPRVAQMQGLLERYGQAVLKLAQREELVERAREQIEPLREEVAAIAWELADAGVPVPRRTRAVNPAGVRPAKPTGAAASGGGPIQGKILDALRGNGRMTPPQIADASGLTASQVSGNITHLIKRGVVTRVQQGVYELSEEGGVDE